MTIKLVPVCSHWRLVGAESKSITSRFTEVLFPIGLLKQVLYLKVDTKLDEIQTITVTNVESSDR
jgi:hypothetical protein